MIKCQALGIPWFLRKIVILFFRIHIFNNGLIFIGLWLQGAEQIESESSENVETKRELITPNYTLMKNACNNTKNQSLLKINGKPLY